MNTTDEQRFPRTRGDEPAYNTLRALLYAFSPHTRG